MAQEQDRDIHLPQPGAAPRAQHPKTAPRAVPLDEAAFRNLPLQDDSAVFSALEDGAGAAPRMPAAGTRQMGGHPAGMAQGAVPLDEAAFRAAAQPRQNAPQGFSALEDAAARPHSGRAPGAPPTGARRAQQPGRPGPGGQGAVPLDEAALRAAGQPRPEQPGPFEGFSALQAGPSSARGSAAGRPAPEEGRRTQRPGAQHGKKAGRPAQGSGPAPGAGKQPGVRPNK